MSAPIFTSEIDGCSYGQGNLSGNVLSAAPPLMILSVEDTVKLVEKVIKQLSMRSYTTIQSSILSLASNLKRHGPSLEFHIGELLDRLQLVLRSACRDKKLDLVSRVQLLEIIELRSFNWAPSEHVTNYYKMKLSEINDEMLDGAKKLPHGPTSVLVEHDDNKTPNSHLNAIAPDFHLGTSYLLMNIPCRPTAQNLFSSTRNRHQSPPMDNIQKPPLGHRQSANHSGDNLGENFRLNTDYSIQAMKDDINARSDDSSKRTTTVRTKNGDITLTSLSKGLLHTVHHILQEELPDQILTNSRSSSTSCLTTDANRGTKPELIYRRTELLELATSPLCRLPPPDWDKIVNEVPSMVKIKPLN